MFMRIIIILGCLLPWITVNAAAFSAEKEAGSWGMVPFPKQVNVGTSVVTLKPPFKIIISQSEMKECADWASNDLQRLFGWKVASDNESMTVEFRIKDMGHGPEAYSLELSQGKIKITAAGKAGGFRAVGRLLAILESDFVKINADSSLECRSLNISDWPDFRLRGMDLQMAYPGGVNAPTRMALIRHTVDAMARLGYNMVVYEVGGCFESKKQPRVSLPSAWTQAQLKELVQYAKARGILAIPGINTIGHLDRAPQLFVLSDAKGRRVAMDIENPDFFPRYFEILDELLEVFGNPDYFHIGADEADKALELLCARPGRDGGTLYGETINRISQHLAKRNCRTIIWHDMLFIQLQPGEPANGKLTSSALDKINNDVIIDYWCYEALPQYSGMERLTARKRDVWVTPWYSPEGIQKLLSASAGRGVDAVLGSTWYWPHIMGVALVLTGEYSWNINAKVQYDPRNVFKKMYHDRPDRLPAPGAQPISFSGGTRATSRTTAPIKAGNLTFDCSQPLFAAPIKRQIFSNPEDAAEVSKSNSGAIITVGGIGRGDEVLALAGVNVSRVANSAVLFTPSYGKKTGTNNYGEEWLILNGKAQKTIDGRKSINDNNIPAKGGVISVHASGNEPQRWLIENLVSGKPVCLSAFFPVNKNGDTTLAATLPEHIRGFGLLLTSEFTIFGKIIPVAEITITMVNGGTEKIILHNDFLMRRMPLPDGPCRFWYASANSHMRLAVLEWNRGKGQAVRSIEVKINDAGAKQGVTLLSGIMW